MSLALADDYTQLAFHVLAHVPRTGPGDLFNCQHCGSASATFSADAQRLLLDDSHVLARIAGPSPADETRPVAENLDRAVEPTDLSALDLLPELHRSLTAFRRSAARPLADLAPHEVADPAALRALQRLGPAAELLHAQMGLLHHEFLAVHARHIQPWGQSTIAAITPWLAALADHAPGLADARVELVWALGPHGRAMPDRILIGCATQDDPITPAILAMHEYAVRTSIHLDYIPGEWDALRRAARWTAAAPPPLRAAHTRWLASLDLTRLLRGAVETGLLTASDAIYLERSPDRAERLRTL